MSPEISILEGMERALLEPRVRRDVNQVGAILDPQFMEIGSTGDRLTMAEVLASLRDEQEIERKLDEFSAVLLSPTVALTRYRLTSAGPAGGAVESRRASVWRFDGQRWRMVFHQGTPIAVNRE